MGYFLLLIGIGLLSRSIVGVWRNIVFKRVSVPSTGTVIENDVADRRGRPRHPIVEYLVDGKKLRFRSDFGANPELYDIGQTVPIRYVRTHPETARIEKTWQIWWDTVGFGIIGIAFLAGGLKMMGAF